MHAQGSLRGQARVPSVLTLSADPRNVRAARAFVRDTLTAHGCDELIELSTLVVSEVVTNAFVHTGTGVTVLVASTTSGVRVEVEDQGDQVPARRSHALTAGTGRGLQLVEELSSRWGVEHRDGGKAVWFEIGTPNTDADTGRSDQSGSQMTLDPAGPRVSDSDDDTVVVTLRQVPLLMHLAWQEHAATLLRELLLFALEDDGDIMLGHARASEAMTLLRDQLPTPVLAEAPDALMAEAIEPLVTDDEVAVRIPRACVGHFATLDDLLSRAIALARSGQFLSPPTQPEINEMRQWLCQEVAQQAAGRATTVPWLARTDVRSTLADQNELTTTYAALADVEEALVATDQAGIIVAASPVALHMLGYGDTSQLVGRRVLAVIPSRFHQAHIAGITLHATNGRDPLLGVPVAVPMTRADGTEIQVTLHVQSQWIDDTRQVFVARITPP